MEEKIDLRIRKTYLSLHNAFTDLLEEKKFEDFTVIELCDRAMIRRTTFYKHFADKYEYFTFYIKEIVATFQDLLAPDVMEGEIDVYLLHMCRELIRFIKIHDRMVQNIRNSSMFPLLLSILLDSITEDITQVLFRGNKHRPISKMQLEGIAAFYAGGLLNALFSSLKKDISIDEEVFVEILHRFLAVGKLE